MKQLHEITDAKYLATGKAQQLFFDRYVRNKGIHHLIFPIKEAHLAVIGMIRRQLRNDA